MTGAPSESLTEFLRRNGLAGLRRAKARKRIYAISDGLADRLCARLGQDGARLECRRRLAFCARRASGLRWQIWCRVQRRLREN